MKALSYILSRKCVARSVTVTHPKDLARSNGEQWVDHHWGVSFYN